MHTNSFNDSKSTSSYYNTTTSIPESAVDAAQEMISILPGVKLDDIIKKPIEKEQFIYKVKKMKLAAS
jgi:hypothetical protein